MDRKQSYPGAGYAESQGLRLLRELASEGRVIFTTEEAKLAAARAGVPPSYLPQLLSRLAAAGWLARLRRGLYAGTGGLPGDVQVHPFAIATRLVTPSAISHWSAMSHHGLTEQVPQAVMAFAPRKVVTPSMRSHRRRKSASRHGWEVAGLRFEYVSVKPEHFFGIEEVWVDQTFKVPMTDKERTLLEGFVSPRMFGGMGEVLSILDEHLDEFDVEKLTSYALRYGKASIAKRLGWALERAGAPPGIVAPLERMPISGFRVLDPTQPRRGPYDRRWMIQSNLTPPAAR